MQQQSLCRSLCTSLFLSQQNGESGTLADAVSPASNPKLIYAGGSNNGASSGIIKSTDMGKHWVGASNGLFHTNVYDTFRLNFHHFDRFQLDLRGHVHVRGAGFSCLRLKLADIVLI